MCIVAGGLLEATASSLTRHLTSHPGLAWMAFLAFFLAIASPLLQRPLWFDELISYHLAKLPTVADQWAAFRNGPDASPPLFHAFVRLSFAAFGEGAWQLRLPPLLGFFVMSACLYLFVRRHSSVVAAWSAALAPLLTSGAAYMAEGRPYGTAVGFASVALLCWQRSMSRAEWSPWLAGAALSAACAGSCHFFGILALAPLACGEAMHQLAGGHVRVLRWLTLAAALLPTVVIGQVLIGLLGIAGTEIWETPTVVSLTSGYRILLGAALAPPIACLCVMAAVRSDVSPPEQRNVPWMPLPESVAGLGFLAVSALAVVAALLTRGPFLPRYGIISLIGFGVLVAGFAVMVERRRAGFASIFLCALITGCALQIVDRWRKAEPRFTLPTMLAADETNLPIVVEGPQDYLQLAYYAPKGLQERLVSLVDPEAALVHVGARRGDLTLARLQRWAPSLRIEQPATFLDRHRRFLLFRRVWPGWVLPTLTAEGAQVTLVRFHNTDAFFTDAVFEVRVQSSQERRTVTAAAGR